MSSFFLIKRYFATTPDNSGDIVIERQEWGNSEKETENPSRDHPTKGCPQLVAAHILDIYVQHV